MRFASQFARSSPSLVAILAILGLALAVLFFFVPEAGSTLADRANVSTAVATVFALLAAIVGVSLGVWLTSSDHAAQQAVKADTARLRAALRSILVKGAQMSQNRSGTTCLDFKYERKTIDEFLSSTTAFGFWSWVEHKGEAAGEGAQETWRVFFLFMADLLEACDDATTRARMYTMAVELEELLATLRRRDIHTISGYMADLAHALGTAKESRDILLQGMARVYGLKNDVKDSE